MKLQPNTESNLTIRKYDGKSISINNVEYTQSIIVFEEIKILDINDIKNLNSIHTNSLIEQSPEVVIVGTGTKQIFPNPALYKNFIDNNIGIEFMTNDAGCRTYNVLLSENRKVALIIIL